MKRSGLVALPLLAIQLVAGGAVALAHARDIVAAPSAVESSHDSRCPVLHDALRCALCHYAGARLVAQRTAIVLPPRPERAGVPRAHRTPVVAGAARYTPPPRAPPALLS